MGVNGFRKAIVLYALVLLFAESVLGIEPLKRDASENEEFAVPLQIQQYAFSEKEDVANSEKIDSSSPQDALNGEQILLKESGNDTEKLANAGPKKPRLAKSLPNFYEQQIINRNNGFERTDSSVSDDEDAIAEERAVRRRQRIRRRKIYSNANRNDKNVRNPNASSSRRKASNNIRKNSSGRIRPSNGIIYAYRKGNKQQTNRKKSKQKRNKNKKSNKTKKGNKKKNLQKRSSEESNSARQNNPSAHI